MAYILLAEDDENVATLFCHWLRAAGHEVTHVNDGLAGLRVALEERQPELIITDFKMPEMDGCTFAGLTRILRPDCPVIAITGYAEESVESMLNLEPNVFALLHKPLDADTFMDAVNQALAQKPRPPAPTA